MRPLRARVAFGHGAARALLTDLYELNMAASYLQRGMGGEATFSLFIREPPPNARLPGGRRPRAVLEFLEGFGLSEEELDYLGRELGFEDPVLDALGALRFGGEVWAVPEGRIVYANEPLLEITAPIAVAQLVEPYLLNQITFQTTIASKAARCVVAAAGRDVVDFSLRRTQGIDAALAAARSRRSWGSRRRATSRRPGGTACSRRGRWRTRTSSRSRARRRPSGPSRVTSPAGHLPRRHV